MSISFRLSIFKVLRILDGHLDLLSYWDEMGFSFVLDSNNGRNYCRVFKVEKAILDFGLFDDCREFLGTCFLKDYGFKDLQGHSFHKLNEKLCASQVFMQVTSVSSFYEGF
jgi:hypothetical protein